MKFRLVLITADFVLGADGNRWAWPFHAQDEKVAQQALSLLCSRGNKVGPSSVVVAGSAPENLACFVFREATVGTAIDPALSSLAIGLIVDLCRQ